MHSNIDAGATRRFRYDAGGGWRADVVVADVSGGAEGDDDAVDKSDLLKRSASCTLAPTGSSGSYLHLKKRRRRPAFRSGGSSSSCPVFLWRRGGVGRQEPEDGAFLAYGTRLPAAGFASTSDAV